MGRASAEDTSIDPTDGNENLQRLLDWIRAAFDIDDPEHPNTSLTLSKGKDDSIEVHITCVLPEPFKPLKWPLYLTKCPASTLATELVLPLIQSHEARAQEIDHLITIIRDKDAVINRLVDKLESNGMGLEHIFNKLLGKRKVRRKEAEGKIKGLAPFAEADFRKDGVQEASRSGDVAALLDTVFRDNGLKQNPGMEFEASAMLDTWWTELGRGRKVVLAERSKRETRTPPPPQSPAKADDDDDDFQVQATPPGLRSAQKRRSTTTRRTVIDDDDTTSEGEDEDVQMTQSPPPRSTMASSKNTPTRRLGALGGRKRRPSPSPSPALPDEDNSMASETASEADGDASTPPPSSKSAPKKGGLGRIGAIGGKAKQRSPEPEPEAARSPSPPPASQPKRHKLGTIGKAPSPKPDSTATRRGRSKSPGAVPKPRETSEERADRKRAELQKELERRAAAGPAKKKRRF